MVRGSVIHLAILAVVAAEWFLLPRAHVLAIIVVTLTLAVALVARLVTSRTAQWLVPTVFRGPTNVQSIAFTFDDGPDPVFTPQILDVLREHNAKATFFVVGQCAERHPDLVGQLVRDGHQIASHTYSHAHTFHFWRAKRMTEDIRKGIDAIERIVGSRPRLFRPPQGLRVPTLRDALAGLAATPTCVTWTVRGLDTVTRSAASITKRVERKLAPGAIIALHDGTGFGGLGDRIGTVEALRKLLVAAEAKGLACVRLDDLLGAGS